MNSMTGYGRSRQVLDGREITVEIRSVNHRYLEYSARIPRMYGYLEEKLKTFLQSSMSRGKVEVTVTIQNLTGGDTVVQINQALAKGYLDAMRSQAESLGLKDDLTLSTLTRFNDVFTLQKLEEDQQVIWNSVQQVARQALDQFLEMRRREGERLKLDGITEGNRLLNPVEFPLSNAGEGVYAQGCRIESPVVVSKPADSLQITLGMSGPQTDKKYQVFFSTGTPD